MAAHGWRERQRPARLERRLEFTDYETLRGVLDDIADLSERTGIYPNQSFGRDYANLTLFADDDNGELTDAMRAFAVAVDALVASPDAAADADPTGDDPADHDPKAA